MAEDRDRITASMWGQALGGMALVILFFPLLCFARYYERRTGRFVSGGEWLLGYLALVGLAASLVVWFFLLS